MKTKKSIIAIAILGGVLFMTEATNSYNSNGTQTIKIDKRKVIK